MDRIGGDETLLRIDVHGGVFSLMKCRANRGGFINERLALLGHLYMRISWEVLLWNHLALVNWSSSKFVIYKLFSFFWHESVRHWNTLDRLSRWISSDSGITSFASLHPGVLGRPWRTVPSRLAQAILQLVLSGIQLRMQCTKMESTFNCKLECEMLVYCYLYFWVYLPHLSIHRPIESRDKFIDSHE